MSAPAKCADLRELVSVGDLDPFDRPVGVLSDQQKIDHPDDVVLSEAHELFEPLAREVRVLAETHHEDLYRTHCPFWSPLASRDRPLYMLCRIFCFLGVELGLGEHAGVEQLLQLLKLRHLVFGGAGICLRRLLLLLLLLLYLLLLLHLVDLLFLAGILWGGWLVAPSRYGSLLRPTTAAPKSLLPNIASSSVR